MSTAKAGKLLAKALDNSSKDEATTAFSMAFSYAERAGIRLSTIHRVEIVEVKSGGSIDPERERELVDKYNSVLKRAKDLTAELATAERLKDDYFRLAGEYLERADEATAHAEYLEGQLEQSRFSMQTAIRPALHKAALEDIARLKAELKDTREKLERTEEIYTEAAIRRNNLSRENGQQRDRMLQLEKDKAELARQLAAEKEARRHNPATAEELAAALAECMTLRATVSEQAKEIDALRSTRHALQIELDKHENSPFKKLFGW